MNVCQKLSCGMKAVMDKTKAFSHTQAVWRFLNNDKVDLPSLHGPVLETAKENAETACDDYILMVHDWSHVNYFHHKSKRDRKQITHKTDVGYELQSSIAVSDRDGLPIAVAAQNLACAQGVWHSNKRECEEEQKHLDELTERIGYLEAQDFAKPLVHIVDREADSVSHLRAWRDRNFIVRVKASSTVRYHDKSIRISKVAEDLSYRETREVKYKGARAIQWVGEAQVVLSRAAKPSGVGPDSVRHKPVKGEPLEVRLVVSRICDAKGNLLAAWYLLTNLPGEVAAERVALWYYYRWNIESFFKLLKEAGQQLESWGQESALAIARRLLIVSQACAYIWQLMREEGSAAAELRSFLVRLSGRQMKRTQPVTATALMDGLFKFLTTSELLAEYSLKELQQFATQLFFGRRWKDV